MLHVDRHLPSSDRMLPTSQPIHTRQLEPSPGKSVYRHCSDTAGGHMGSSRATAQGPTVDSESDTEHLMIRLEDDYREDTAQRDMYR